MSNTPGCRCIDCFDRKPHTRPDERAIQRLLDRTEAPLRLVQADQGVTRLAPAATCDGSYTCECETCQRALLGRIRRRKPRGDASPFRKAA